MTPLEGTTHVFIVRLWRESEEVDDSKTLWRGVIEHVPSGERRYLANPSEIWVFMAVYINDMGMIPGGRPQLGKWLRGLRFRLRQAVAGHLGRPDSRNG